MNGHRSFSSVPPHTKLEMPALSPTMEQGNLGAWKKKEGDHIAAGEVLAEVETDKATLDWEAVEEGYLAKILVPAGTKDLKIGTPLAIVVDDQSDVAAFSDYVEQGSASEPSPPSTPAPAAAAPEAKPAGSFPTFTPLSFPALSPTMSQGNIVSWAKKEGDAVAPGDVLCTVETDKSVLDWEAQEEGFIAKLLAPDGAKDIPIGATVAVIVDDESSIPAFASFTAADALPTSTPATSAPATSEPAPEPSPVAAAPVTPAPLAAAAPQIKQAAPGTRVIASPYAKKLAAEAGVGISGLMGSGPGGRIVAGDVAELIASGKGAVPTDAAAALGMPGFVDIPHTQIRRITAKRLVESKQTVPHYYLTVECRIDELMRIRKDLNERLAKDGVKLSLNDFVIKAAALALKKVPGMNSSWHSEFIREYNSVDMTVAVQTPAGLMVPVVRSADKKGLQQISADVKELAAKAREGKLRPEEFSGGTFTISNLGMYGVRQFCAIINPPQAGILAVGAGHKKVVEGPGGTFGEVNVMMCTVSCDHRVVDGAMGAQWLQAFQGYVEEPLSMML
ncbi:unnamed protein product [Ostreobium quekettii]|uniref:Acetyltransferase component of pyruvate dehydrogenase complex n=1 Tax=Ostreobium quekettii TaxID=121088 RepID=A0A8S1IT23_9CHLO|nr:unnamed protein product [Ostreobium quekettii]|eukprot:evm.model.scf_92.4 EVM.evm.TU.scf_92.4   scf_92:46579-57982(+)